MTSKAGRASMPSAADDRNYTLIGQGQVVVAAGSFVHRIPATGKQFASDWALRCTIRDGKIIRYQFFEDTAAAVEAFQPVAVASPAA